MKRTAASLAVAALLTGCAGLQTDWVLRLQMQYSTPAEKPVDKPAENAAGKPA